MLSLDRDTSRVCLTVCRISTVWTVMRTPGNSGPVHVRDLIRCAISVMCIARTGVDKGGPGPPNRRAKIFFS